VLRYAVTIFLSAFLLFQVQPLISKVILPWFGGGPSVWTTCMVFFQVALLGGYAYAHIAGTRLRQRRQVVVHLVILAAAAALALLYMRPSAAWKPAGPENAAWRILGLLAVCVGLPYFVLSTTGPLLQAWFSRTSPGKSPYRLYALSNVGSLLALLSFPFVVEPWLTSSAQITVWSAAFAAFAGMCGYCALRTWDVTVSPEGFAPVPLPKGSDLREGIARTRRSEELPEYPPEGVKPSGGGGGVKPSGGGGGVKPSGGREGANDAKSPCFWDHLFWLGLPACASVLLIAMTNRICQDVAVVPFLWVLPLSLYLLSFIICFDSERWYVRPVFWPAFLLSLVVVVWLMTRGVGVSVRVLLDDLGLMKRIVTSAGATRFVPRFDWLWLKSLSEVGAGIQLQVIGYSACLLVFCMVCHGELVRLKPKPRYLTSFYLMVSAGGALGGVFVGLIAPLVFSMHYELHVGLWVCLAMVMEAIWFQMKPQERWRPEWLVWVGLAVCLMALLGYGWALFGEVKKSRKHAISVSRSFYGVLTVYDVFDPDAPELHHYSLYNGRILHGVQFVAGEGRQRPTSYYGDESGVGLAVRRLRLDGSPMRVGVIGLGTGTIAAHGKRGDYYTFYEINSQVKKLSEGRRAPETEAEAEVKRPIGGFFTYLKDLEARGGTYDVAMGDARLSLERQPSQQFDVLAIDAFTSDAIPVHLLTREAFAIYQRHLKKDGILAVHISNRYLDLRPVVWALAELYSYKTALIDSEDDEPHLVDGAVWVLVTRNDRFLDDREVVKATKIVVDPPANRLWTDDYSNLFQILN